MKPDDLRRFFERDLKQAVPGAKLKSLKLQPENMLDMSSNLHAELEFSADGMTATGHDKAIVTLPWIGNRPRRGEFHSARHRTWINGNIRCKHR